MSSIEQLLHRSMSILAGASSLVDSTNAMLTEVCTSEQREENLAANSAAARTFIEDMELSMVNQGLYAALSLSIKTWSFTYFFRRVFRYYYYY